ncbi:hypothetical protein BLOT_007384 [Blomia tropicalis]|nr:hypothetical protein BLOT_007384 [Blomia tropicalis]
MAEGVNVTPNDSTSIEDTIISVFSRHFLCTETNRYRHQNECKWACNSKTLKWVDVVVAEMKKFIGTIILMGQVRKDRIRDYWSTNQLQLVFNVLI